MCTNLLLQNEATPLAAAANEGHTEIVEILLDYSANVNHMAIVSLF